MIIIAYNHNGKVISIVNAKSEELTNAYWHGEGTIPHSIKVLEKDFTPLEEHPIGVIPLLATKKVSLTTFGQNPTDYIVVK